MFYTIGLLVAFSVILLIFDHKSRYSYLFVLMATGATLAFFSIILHINMFASYGDYYGGSIYYRLDYMIYKAITARLALPIVVNIRLMNEGVALFLLAEMIFNYEFQKNLGRSEPKMEKGEPEDAAPAVLCGSPSFHNSLRSCNLYKNVYFVSYQRE